MELKLEVGKYYKTRSGLVAKVICVDSKLLIGKQSFPVIALVDKPEGQVLIKCQSDGKFLVNQTYIFDLVSEYKEPEYVYMNFYEKTVGSQHRTHEKAKEYRSNDDYDKFKFCLQVNKETGETKKVD